MVPEAPDILTDLAPRLARNGLTPTGKERLARGSTTTVWRIETAAGSFALRLFHDDHRAPDGRIDAALRSALRARGGAVVAPLMSSETEGIRVQGRRWCLEPFVSGDHPERGALSAETCAALGQTLSSLHALPVAGFGRLIGARDGVFQGGTDDPLAGVGGRFENPLPELWSSHDRHPALAELPDIADTLLDRLAKVAAQVRRGRAVVCHTDLHEKQMICKNGRLAALIDFADAAVLDRHWDLGSVLYFHGSRVFEEVFSAYRTTAGDTAADPDMARSFALAIAMHHASRSRLPGKGHRRARAVQFIRDHAGAPVPDAFNSATEDGRSGPRDPGDR